MCAVFPANEDLTDGAVETRGELFIEEFCSIFELISHKVIQGNEQADYLPRYGSSSLSAVILFEVRLWVERNIKLKC